MIGTHTGRAFLWELARASTGTESLLVKFALDTGEYVYWNAWLSEKAWQRTVAALKLCGWDGADFERLDGMGTKDVELVLEEEEYEGKTQTKVKWVNAIGGAKLEPKGQMTGDEKRRFVAKMQARLAAMSPATAQRPKAAQKAPVDDDDDIPF